jgi:uncharacterized protein
MQRGAGGTPGGVGSFILGAIMALAGGYILTNQIVVTNSFWSYRVPFLGQVSAFGVILIPFLIGVGMIFFNYRSVVGWILAGGSLVLILVGVITNLQVYFAPTSLFVTLIMLVLLVGGIGLMVRGLIPSRG